MTINHYIKPNYNTFMDRIIPSSEHAPSLSIQMNDNTIADKIVPTSEHASLLSGQTNNVPDLANANPSASRQPKRTINPKLQADQADISDNNCKFRLRGSKGIWRNDYLCWIGLLVKGGSCAVLCCPMAVCRAS